MALSKEQLDNLLTIAKQHWIEAEAAINGYDRAYQSTDRVSKQLKLATVISAILTAISTALPKNWPTEGWLTILVAAITAALATYEQQYSPAANSQKFWESRSELDAVKRDLNSCAINISEADDISSGLEPFNSVGGRISAAKKIPVTISDNDRNFAEGSFKKTVIARLLGSSDRALTLTDDDVGLAEDAPDVMIAVKPRRSAYGGGK